MTPSAISPPPELVVAGSNRWRVIKDHLGSVRMVVDTATGDIKLQTTFDAFGRILSSGGTVGLEGVQKEVRRQVREGGKGVRD